MSIPGLYAIVCCGYAQAHRALGQFCSGPILPASMTGTQQVPLAAGCGTCHMGHGSLAARPVAGRRLGRAKNNRCWMKLLEISRKRAFSQELACFEEPSVAEG